MMSRLLIVLTDAALRSLALSVVVWLAIWILRPRSARLRATIWTVVLIAATAMPLLTRWRIFEVPAPATIYERAITTNPLRRADLTSTPTAPPTLTRPVAISWESLAAAVYLTVSSLLLLRIVCGFVLTERTWRRAKLVSPSSASRPRVREATNISAPAATGLGILFPVDWRDWDETKLRAVLAHEGSHISHGDFYVRLLARLHAAIFWFSPLAWWLSHELSELQEAASDDEALSVFPNRSSYAEILLFFAQKQPGASFTLAMARMSTLSRRVDRVLAFATAPARVSSKQYATVTVCLVAITTLIAGCSISAQTVDRSGDRGEPYVIVSGDSTTMSGSSEDAESARSLRARVPGDYLWFLRGGKSYMITDPAIVNQAKELFRPQEELGQKQEELGAQQEELGKQQEKLGEQQSRVSVKFPDMEAESRAIQKELERAQGTSVADAKETLRKLDAELKQSKDKQLTQEKISEIQEKVSELQSRISDSHADLENKLGAMQSRFGDLQSRAGEEQSRLGEQQSKLGEQQSKLGEQQSRLGDQQSELAEKASRQIRVLIDQALRSGRANPVQ